MQYLWGEGPREGGSRLWKVPWLSQLKKWWVKRPVSIAVLLRTLQKYLVTLQVWATDCSLVYTSVEPLLGEASHDASAPWNVLWEVDLMGSKLEVSTVL